MPKKVRRRLPIRQGFFTLPDSFDEIPRFLGTCCKDCGEHFFPKRAVCAKCNSQNTVDATMSALLMKTRK